MAREVVDELVSKVVLETASAVRASRDFAAEQRKLREETARVEKATRAQEEASASLREQALKLRRAEMEGRLTKKELAQETAKVRLRLGEQAEASRKLREEQKRLRAEERALQAEARAASAERTRQIKTEASTAREASRQRAAAIRAEAAAARDLARAHREAERAATRSETNISRDRAATTAARHRSEVARDRERMGWRQQQASGKRIEELEESISKSDVRLHRLTGRPLGRIRTRVEDAIGALPERKIGPDLQHLGSGAASLGRMTGGALVGGAGLVGGAVAGIGAIGSEFERLRASLETIEGSSTKAQKTFATIQEFAKTTPYGLQEATTAFVKLKARGLDATLPALRTYGDTASAMGKSLDEMIEAVADATTGEFERLKEFGIKASTQGDKVKFTFKGVATTVGKNAQEIEQYLQQLGAANFAGGMERQSQTLAGQLSSLGDAAMQLADEAFRSGLGDALKEVVSDMAGMAGEGQSLAKVIGKALGDAVRNAWRWIKDTIGPTDQLAGKFHKAWETASTFVGLLVSVAGKIASFASAIGGANTAILAMGLGLMALTGPLGAVAALGATLGGTLVSAFMDAKRGLLDFTSEAERAQQQAEEVARRKRIEENTRNWDATHEAMDLTRQQMTRRDDLGEKVLQSELRRRGVGKLEDLSEKDRLAVTRLQYGAVSALRGETAEDFDKRAAALERDIEGRGRSADDAEMRRLQDKVRGRGKLTPAERKRLTSLQTKYDVVSTKAGPKAKKEKDDAFTAARKKEIDDLVHAAEREAGDRAMTGGNAAGAAAAAKSAGKARREQLESMVAGGQALPGEVERSLLRAAGFQDVQNAPPPPITVTNQRFEFHVTVPIDATMMLEGSADEVAGDLSEEIKTRLERDVLPSVYEMYRTSFLR